MRVRLLVALLPLLPLGCAGWEPLEVERGDDMKSGPGLISGEDGELAVEIGLSREPDETEEQAEQRRTDEARN